MTISVRLGLCAILIGCVLLAGCGESGKVAAAPAAGKPSAERTTPSDRIVLPAGSPKLERIRVEPVAMGRFVLAEVTAPGEVEVNPSHVSRVLMPVTGRIREVRVHLGDSVTEGQPVVAIESPDAAAALAAHTQAQAQIRQAKSAVLKSERDLARLRELNEHGAVPLKEVQAAENDAVQGQANLDEAQAAAEAAVQRLKTLGLEPGQLASVVFARAPISGKVMEIAVAPGEYRNDTSASLMTVADLSTVWMSALVPETRIRYIEVGEAVRAEFSAYPGEEFRARVMRIADTVDAQTRTIKVDAEIPNPSGRLRPAMFGQIHHVHDPVPKPAVPVSAVVQTGGRPVVYVEESPGVFRERTITTGERQNGLLPAMSGLAAGERIVVDGVMLLRTEAAER
jgi:cobalt-zinc-cadmium efflux system membrane fusion protein